MLSWIRRSVALAAFAGAAWLDLAARGAPARASLIAHALQGDGMVSVAALATVALVATTMLVALSPAGRAPRPTASAPPREAPRETPWEAATQVSSARAGRRWRS